MVGVLLEELEEEDDVRFIISFIIVFLKEGCYEVVGIVKDRDVLKLDFMKEVIKVRDMYSYFVFIKVNFE